MYSTKQKKHLYKKHTIKVIIVFILIHRKRQAITGLFIKYLLYFSYYYSICRGNVEVGISYKIFCMF